MTTMVKDDGEIRPIANDDLAEDHKEMMAELREEARTNKSLRKMIRRMDQEAIDGLPDTSLTGLNLAVALFDSIDERGSRDAQWDRALQLHQWLELLGRDETALAAIKEYCDLLTRKMLSGTLTNKEYVRYQKMAMLENK